MNKADTPLLLSMVFCTTLAWPLSSQADIKCWTNRDGVRECGNMVPPEYAQQESRTINERGITTDVKERAPTKEELEEQRRQQEAERQRLEEEKRQQALEEQRRKERENYDRVLLSTFLSEEEILNSRDRKLSAIDATIEITRITIDKLQDNLDKEKGRAANLERQGKPIPERRQEDIDSLQKQIDEKKSYIASKEREKQELTDKYAADLERFRELKAEGRHLR
jgi:chromosome segregation ATPase